ncbi:beta-1,3-galactosyltransferase 1 [Scaptodrosophila lebanonensis]|uniref:Hexosyltransferase n=1 Tax=Drosophila lebanonensis TaxID=7225 RepID=A0A6J2UK10_DROLE|nr:beta-1,3-galactosyltransferase 1 [Scaptodrosophila lebanonensis]
MARAKRPLAAKNTEEQRSLLTDINLGDLDEEVKLSGKAATAKILTRGTYSISVRNRRKYWYWQRGALRRFLFCVPVVFLLVLVVFYLPIYTDVQNRRSALPDWTYNTSRDIKDYVLPLEQTALIVPRDFCRAKTFVIIAVCSGLQNFVQRQTIRETWGNTTEFNYSKFSKLHGHLKGHYLERIPARLKLYEDHLKSAPVRVIFIVGRSKYESLLGNETLERLHNEAEHYNDIIQENFIDSYNNLTLKSVLALKHMSKDCSNSSAFFLKCDDDTFVNVPNLLHFLLGGTLPLYNDTLEYYDVLTAMVMSPENRLNATKGIMRGHQFCSARPVSNVTNKWYMPYYMYPKEAYPKYLSGAGYLMSMDVAQGLYKAALNTTLIYLEDIYITALCAEKARVKRQHHPLFSYTYPRHLCAFKGAITQHEVKDDSMMEAWQFVSNYSIKCDPPGRYFKQMRLRKHINC